MSTASVNNLLKSEGPESSQSSQSSRLVNVPQIADRNHSSLIVAKIEAIFASMVDVLVEGGDALSIPYRRRNLPQRTIGSVKFPGRSVTEAAKFSQRTRQPLLT